VLGCIVLSWCWAGDGALPVLGVSCWWCYHYRYCCYCCCCYCLPRLPILSCIVLASLHCPSPSHPATAARPAAANCTPDRAGPLTATAAARSATQRSALTSLTSRPSTAKSQPNGLRGGACTARGSPVSVSPLSCGLRAVDAENPAAALRRRLPACALPTACSTAPLPQSASFDFALALAIALHCAAPAAPAASLRSAQRHGQSAAFFLVCLSVCLSVCLCVGLSVVCRLSSGVCPLCLSTCRRPPLSARALPGQRARARPSVSRALAYQPAVWLVDGALASSHVPTTSSSKPPPPHCTPPKSPLPAFLCSIS
jgi:hypothetical protein